MDVLDETQRADRPAADPEGPKNGFRQPKHKARRRGRAHPPTPEDPREAVSVWEACEITGLGRSTIYQLIRDGTLASVKIGKRRLIFRRSCSDLLRRGA